jgi:hypothetical protein
MADQAGKHAPLVHRAPADDSEFVPGPKATVHEPLVHEAPKPAEPKTVKVEHTIENE